MTNNPLILDACCGSKLMWFDRENPIALFNDIRCLETTLCDGRPLKISPDTQYDFTDLPFEDGSFKMVVFDPPHLKKAGPKSWMAQKYGKLSPNWKEDITKGFAECFRVLENNGFLIFKWAEVQIKTREILACSKYRPLFGHISGLRGGTHWLVFIKNKELSSITESL